MTVAFPPGVTATPPSAADGPRVVDFRFDILDSKESTVGLLEGVGPSGELKWDYNAAIKGGGTIGVVDTRSNTDWLNVRIRPVMITRGPGASVTEASLGVFLPSAPTETWTATGRSWSVELMDKNCILDQDIVTDGYGQPTAFSVVKGANIIEAVRGLIIGAGETAPAILPGGKTARLDMTWDMGTTRLKIINDLLDAANYFSLWCDSAGQYQATQYLDPEDRPVVYALRTPFSKGDFSLMSPDWTRDRDIYSIPNRYVAISQGDGEDKALTSVAANMNPDSPYSYPSRGRWITQVLTGADASTQSDLDAIAKRGLTNFTAVANMIKVSHAYLPEVQVNRVVQFLNPDADLDIRCYVTNTTVPFDPMALCSTELREVGS